MNILNKTTLFIICIISLETKYVCAAEENLSLDTNNAATKTETFVVCGLAESAIDEEQYVMNRDDYDVTLYDMNTPLHLAIIHRDTPKALSLIAAGADLSAKNSDGKIPQDFATSTGMKALLKPATKLTENTPLL